MTIIDVHLLAVINASQAALDLCEMLPETDIVIELHKTLAEQFAILITAIDGRHYGSDRLHKFIKNCDRVIKQSQQKQKEKKCP